MPWWEEIVIYQPGHVSKLNMETIIDRTEHSLSCSVYLCGTAAAEEVMMVQWACDRDAEGKCNYCHFPGGWSSALQNSVLIT